MFHRPLGTLNPLLFAIKKSCSFDSLPFFLGLLSFNIFFSEGSRFCLAKASMCHARYTSSCLLSDIFSVCPSNITESSYGVSSQNSFRLNPSLPTASLKSLSMSVFVSPLPPVPRFLTRHLQKPGSWLPQVLQILFQCCCIHPQGLLPIPG